MSVQSEKWDGYFDENKDTIMGNWRRCRICHRIPSEIYYDTVGFYTIWHCRTCKPREYKPKNLLESFLILIDKMLTIKKDKKKIRK